VSAQAFSWVCEHADAQGTDRLVLLVLANYAGDLITDGTETFFECWPGIGRIAEDARLDSRRTVQNALTRLVASGQIERIINAAPDQRVRGDRRSNLYRIHTKPRPLAAQIGRRFAAEDAARHPALRGLSTADADASPRALRKECLFSNGSSNDSGVARRHPVASSDDTPSRRETTPRGPDGVSSDDTPCELSTVGAESPAESSDTADDLSHPLARRAATATRRLAPTGGQH